MERARADLSAARRDVDSAQRVVEDAQQLLDRTRTADLTAPPGAIV
jgi:hypothetical protein